jgi:rubrerythrin
MACLINPLEALNLALARELEAVKTYEKLSNECSFAKETFLMLVDEERRHVKLIEDLISRLPKA